MKVRIKQKAFTLIEILVTITIIGILFVLVTSKVGASIDKANVAGVKTDFKSFYLASVTTASEKVPEELNTLPKFVRELNSNLDNGVQFKLQSHNVAVSNKKDPWGNSYRLGFQAEDDSDSVMIVFTSSAGGHSRLKENIAAAELEQVETEAASTEPIITLEGIIYKGRLNNIDTSNTQENTDLSLIKDYLQKAEITDDLGDVEGSYTITYDLAGGTIEKENPTEYTPFSPDLPLNNPRKDGWVFAGWSSRRQPTPNTNYVIESGSFGNILITANWKAKELNPIKLSDTTCVLREPTQPKTITIESNPSGMPLTVVCEDPTIASVSYDGDKTITATWKKAGSTNILISSGESDSYKATTIKCQVECLRLVTLVDTKNGNAVYTGEPQTGGAELTVTRPASGYTIKYGLSEKDCTLSEMPSFTDAGKYDIYYKVEAPNYEAASGSLSVTISKAPAEVITPRRNAVKYTGSSVELMQGFSCKGGTLYFKDKIKSQSGEEVWASEWSTDSPKRTDKGTYPVKYYCKGDKNHTDTKEVEVEIDVDDIFELIDGDTIADDFEIAKWNYTTDKATSTVKLLDYVGTSQDVTIYSVYPINGNYYRPILNEGSNIFGKGASTPKTLKFCKNIPSIKSLKNFLFRSSNLISVDLSNLDYSQVTDATSMFSGCSNIPSIDLTPLGNPKISNMTEMFRSCSSLTSINLTGINTESATDLTYIFNGCRSLISVDLSPLNTKSVSNMRSAFSDCTNLQTIVLQNNDWTNLTNLDHTFCYCSNLGDVDFGEKSHCDLSTAWCLFYQSGVTGFKANFETCGSMSCMFFQCGKLKYIDLPYLDTSNSDSFNSMCCYDGSLETINIKNFSLASSDSLASSFFRCGMLTSLNIDWSTTANTKYFSRSLWGCFKLKSLDLSKIDTSSAVTMEGMFYECSGLETLDLSAFNTSKVTNMACMFYKCSSLKFLDLSSFDTKQINTMDSMFFECKSLSELNISSFDTSNVTNMKYMFTSCESLTKLDVSKFDTSKVSNMYAMFSGCKSVTKLDVSKFNTSKVLYMDTMFRNCPSLSTVDITNFDFSSTTNVFNMFDGDTFDSLDFTNRVVPTQSLNGIFNNLSVKTLDASNLDISQTNSIHGLFGGCHADKLIVPELDTSHITDFGGLFSGATRPVLDAVGLDRIDTTNAVNMDQMFENSNTLTELDLSHFNFSNVVSAKRMFYGCTKLTSLNLGTSKFTNLQSMNEMFRSCGSLTELDLSNKGLEQCTDFSWAFQDCVSVTKVNMTGCTCSKASDLSYIFSNCRKLIQVDLEPFKTAKISSLQYAFAYMWNSKELNLSNLDTSELENLSNLACCSNFTSITLPLGSYPKLKYVNRLAYRDGSLKAINVEVLNVSKVSDFYSSFQYTSNLDSIDVSGWNVSGQVNMNSIFMNSSSVLTLDLHNWDLTYVTDVRDFFTNMSKLETLTTPKEGSQNISLPKTMYDASGKAYTIMPYGGIKLYATKP